MANLKTLKPFKKGIDTRRNVSGRPKLTRLTEALREQISATAPDAPEQTIAEQIAQTLIKLAIDGDVQAIREIADRTEGKPKQAIDIGSRNGEPLLITFDFRTNTRLKDNNDE